ncbi:MAG: class I SAM-dependent methyltransferase [Ruminiclostridium sp.]|nr:class I SAM-dependent methyltransferase [Ruminiclostridium sp.]
MTMGNKEENLFISFYGEHFISPVHQDISDLNLHLSRREKLYRMLGLPPVAFKGKTILEVGPGGGYNSLAFFVWGADMDFIEPNPKAQEEIPDLLRRHNIERERWSLQKCRLEDAVFSHRYDIVIAEGFIPGLNNREPVIRRLSDVVNPGGVIVVTCIDDISFFFENIRRLISARLTGNTDIFQQKVDTLCEAFSTHLKNLIYASRPVEDWVTDQFLNPALYADLFSIEDCINEFDEGFEILGSSPDLFTDYSWYKDMDYNSKNAALIQFEQKRHMFIWWRLPEGTRQGKDNHRLLGCISELRRASKKYEENISENCLNIIIQLLRKISILVGEIDPFLKSAVEESIALLADKELNPRKVSDVVFLPSAFGRGQQYVSMVKKFL